MFVVKEGTPTDKIGEGTDPNTVKAIEGYLAKSGYVIRTADAEKTFLESHTQQQIDSVMSTRNSQIEADVETLTGIKRNASEKHFDFLKRAVSSRLGEITDLKTKIADYEKKGGAGSEQIINDLKNQLSSAQDTYTKTIAEKEDALSKLSGEFFGTRLNGNWDSSLGKVRGTFVENVFLNSELEMRKTKFFNEHAAEESNGQLVYKNKTTGKILISTKDGKPKSTDEVVSELYIDLVDKKRTQGGGGSAGGGQGDPTKTDAPDPSKWKEHQIPADKVKTGVQLHDYMTSELKMDMNTKEFGDAYKHWMTTMKLRIK